MNNNHKWEKLTKPPKTVNGEILHCVISTLPNCFCNEYEVAIYDSNVKLFKTATRDFDPRDIRNESHYYLIFTPAPNHFFEIA